jgi:arabinofuranosyltransferase
MTLARWPGERLLLAGGMRAWLERSFLALVVIAMTAMQAIWAWGQTVTIQGRRFPVFLDDTYISMRYARHLVDGHGLVWNIGEAPIEGFTNFLWVLWIALLTKVFGDPSYAMIASAAGCHVISVVLFYRLLRDRYQVHWLPACSATLLLAAWEPIRFQVFVGMEAPLLLCLFVTALYLISAPPTAKASRLTGALAAGLLPLVRPDGVFLTVLLVMLYLATQDRGRMADELGRHTTALVCFLAPLVALTLGKIMYFGDALPNTYYLKIVDRPGRVYFGLVYVSEFLKSFYGSLLLVPLLVFAIVQRTAISLVAAAGVVGILGYVAYQGGDFTDWWRFMVPMLPLFLLLFALLATKCLLTRFLRIVGVVLCLGIVIVGARHEYELVTTGSLFIKPPPEMVNNIRLGLALRAVCSSEAVTADFWAGATPFFSGLRSIDMLGRSDRVIARRRAYKPGGVPGHDKFDAAYVLRRAPDVIVSTHPLRLSRAGLEAAKRSDYPFGADLLEKLEAESAYMPIESVLSESWHGIYARKDSRACDWERLPAIERQLGLI